jgi:hypothetical protein
LEGFEEEPSKDFFRLQTCVREVVVVDSGLEASRSEEDERLAKAAKGRRKTSVDAGYNEPEEEEGRGGDKQQGGKRKDQPEGDEQARRTRNLVAAGEIGLWSERKRERERERKKGGMILFFTGAVSW